LIVLSADSAGFAANYVVFVPERSAFQAEYEGSIPFTRSSVSRRFSIAPARA
jgi:hypothetical protein